MKVTQETRRMLMDRKIVECLIEKKSQRAIVRELRVGDKRVRKLERLAREAGYLDGSKPLPQYPEALFESRRGSLQPPSDAEKQLMPHKDWIAERVKIGWHLVTIFEELPVKVNRSSFYRFLSRHSLAPQKAERVVPEIVHEPGEALLLDWGHLCTIKDPQTGQKRKLWAFVGVLGYSRYLVVRLVWTNTVDVTLAALSDMLREIGGVPKRVTTDNPKCFALEASDYEPILNPAFELFAGHFGFRIECLPPRDPEKKGKVERPMPYIRRLFESHGSWEGIEEAQEFINRKLAIANERKHGTTLEKPISRLVDVEAAALKPLPATHYEIEECSEPTVRADGHVRFKGKYYSVGEGLTGKNVVVLGNSKTVRIYYQGKLLEVHERVTDPQSSKSTKNHHRKPWEQALSDNHFYLKRALEIGQNCKILVEKIIGFEGGFIDTRMIWGIFDLTKKFNTKDVDDACKIALSVHSYSYRTVKSYLEHLPVKKPQEKSYCFVRNMNEYTSLIKEKETNDDARHTHSAT